jgi:hypothetical protein
MRGGGGGLPPVSAWRFPLACPLRGIPPAFQLESGARCSPDSLDVPTFPVESDKLPPRKFNKGERKL